MNDQPISNACFTAGEHKGEKLKDVSTDYLYWAWLYETHFPQLLQKEILMEIHRRIDFQSQPAIQPTENNKPATESDVYHSVYNELHKKLYDDLSYEIYMKVYEELLKDFSPNLHDFFAKKVYKTLRKELYDVLHTVLSNDYKDLTYKPENL